jgi:hypothetical protein
MAAGYARLLQGFDADSDPWGTLARLLLDRTRLAAEVANAGDVAGRARGIAIWQFMNFVRAQPGQREGAIGALLERIKRLVRLSDDRDLRHIPQAARGIDAVRLMTMHGSKGLQFPVVHIPGMALNTLPRSAKAPACPPPDGMIAGATERGRAVTDREHAEEQECLFYVALSRARDRLFLYSPNQNAGGAKRQASPFIKRLGAGVVCTSVVPAQYSVAPDEPPIPVRYVGDPIFWQSALGLYERCSRRFFYTHILKLGGSRITTPYEDLHDVVRKAMAELLGTPGTPSAAGLEALVDRHWAASSLAALPTGPAYRPLADELVDRFVRRREDGAPMDVPPLALTIGGAEIRVEADYAFRQSDGVITLRQVQTGHLRSSVMKDSAVVRALLFATHQSASNCTAEILFLSDDACEGLDLTDKVLNNRRTKLAGVVADILAGTFPTDPSTRTCPKCPAFFTCGAVPKGELEKSFA